MSGFWLFLPVTYLSLLAVIALVPGLPGNCDSLTTLGNPLENLLWGAVSYWLIALLGYHAFSLLSTPLNSQWEPRRRRVNKGDIATNVAIVLYITVLVIYRSFVSEPWWWIPPASMFLFLLVLSILAWVRHGGYALWFLRAGGQDDLRIGIILAAIVALPVLLRVGVGDQVKPNPGMKSPLWVTLVILTVYSLCIASLEESFFRGFLQTRLAKPWGLNRSIVCTAFLFGLFHVPLYVHSQRYLPSCLHESQRFYLVVIVIAIVCTAIVGEGAMGLLLGSISASRGGSLIVPITLHTSINVLALLFSPSDERMLAPPFQKLTAWDPADEASLFVNLLVLCVLVTLVIAAAFFIKRRAQKNVSLLNINTATPEQITSWLLNTSWPRNRDSPDELARLDELAHRVITYRPFAKPYAILDVEGIEGHRRKICCEICKGNITV